MVGIPYVMVSPHRPEVTLSNHFSALQLACSLGDVTMACMLIELGAPPDQVLPSGENIYITAVAQERTGMLPELLRCVRGKMSPEAYLKMLDATMTITDESARPAIRCRTHWTLTAGHLLKTHWTPPPVPSCVVALRH